MGKLLEALKRAQDTNQCSEPVLSAVCLEPEPAEPVEEEFPFIEVGGPRPESAGLAQCRQISPRLAPKQTPHLEMPAPRAATLQMRQPNAVTLQPAPASEAAPARVAAEIVAFHQPQNPVSQQYAELFGQLPLQPINDCAPVLLVTALAAGAGTTTCLLNLAVAGSQKHAKRIVVVDANTARPAAAGRLGAANASGLHEVLEGRIALEQAVARTPIKDLHVLPAGSPSAQPMLGGDAIRWVLAWLRQRYDLVLVDAPPWDAGNEMRALLPATAAVYLVLDAGETDQPAVRAAARDIARLGSRLGGFIVTQ